MGLRGLEELRLGCYHIYFVDGYIDVEVLPGGDEGWVQTTYLREEKEVNTSLIGRATCS